MSGKPYESESLAAARWWSSLQPQRRNDGSWSSGDRASLSRLRRASSILDALAEPATAYLFRKLGLPDKDDGASRIRAALLAGVLSHVRNDDRGRSIASVIGSRRGDAESQQLVTPLRFKRLIAAREPDELLTAFRRVVAILGDTANVKDLARTLLAFTDPDDRRADIARTRFAFDYHGAGQYAPDDETSRKHVSDMTGTATSTEGQHP